MMPTAGETLPRAAGTPHRLHLSGVNEAAPEMMNGERQQDPAEELKRADNGLDPEQPSLSQLRRPRVRGWRQRRSQGQLKTLLTDGQKQLEALGGPILLEDADSQGESPLNWLGHFVLVSYVTS